MKGVELPGKEGKWEELEVLEPLEASDRAIYRRLPDPLKMPDRINQGDAVVMNDGWHAVVTDGAIRDGKSVTFEAADLCGHRGVMWTDRITEIWRGGEQIWKRE